MSLGFHTVTLPCERREESGFNEKSRTSENVRFNFVNALANLAENRIVQLTK